MERADPLPARLLVVEDNYALREALLSLLAEEGYAPSGVASLEDALARVEQQAYALILADLFAGVSKHTFTPAHILRRRLKHTPLGLITAQPRVLEAPQLVGFAFAVPPPIDVSLLFTEIAACLEAPLSRQQQRQARSVERFLAAWCAQEWKSLLSFCTDDVLVYPSFLFRPAASRAVQGKLALLGLVTAFRHRYHRVRLEAQGLYRRPAGLALRYNGCVADYGAMWQFFSGAALFQFAGERICQIGTPISDQHWRALTGEPPASLGSKGGA